MLTTSAAAIEINQSIDTRIAGLQVYAGNAAVLQTGYAEGIYLVNPLIVGTDYVLAQTNQTQWKGYAPNKAMLLGLWIQSGELNTNLGCLKLANVSIGLIAGCDITRDGGPTTAQTAMDFTDVSYFAVQGCNFLGGAVSQGAPDTGFSFKSTWNSSSNSVSACHFENMTTAIAVVGPNGTVGLATFGITLANIPAATAILDGSVLQSSNFLTFIAPGTGSAPAGVAKTQDHLWTNVSGQPLFRVSTAGTAANFLRVQPAASGAGPALSFEGTDAAVAGTITTKGGNLTLSAGGANSGSGNLLGLVNVPGSTGYVTIQNATGSNACTLSTNAGGLAVQPRGTLTCATAAGIFMPGLPTSKPAPGSNQLWNNSGVLSIA